MMIFAQATKNKLRFKVSNGILSTEDLWDLSLVTLNDLARALSKELKNAEESFIEEKSPTDKTLELKFNVVKSIIDDKLADRNAAREKSLKQARRRELLSILNEKDTESLRAKTREELLTELENL